MKFKAYLYHMTDIPDIQKKTTPDNTGNQKPELYGVGGWLLFFWISLVFISPLYAVVSLHGDITSQEMSAPGLETVPLWGHIKGYDRSGVGNYYGALLLPDVPIAFQYGR